MSAYTDDIPYTVHEQILGATVIGVGVMVTAVVDIWDTPCLMTCFDFRALTGSVDVNKPSVASDISR